MFVCAQCGKRYEQAGYCAADGSPLAGFGDPLLGSDVGRYRLTSVIGEGGMGRVYLGVHPGIGSRVAVKVLSDQCTHNPDLLQRFFAEARSVNMIRHESIVSVIDMAVLPDGRPYIVMEFIEGKTLSSVLAGGRAPLGGVVQLMTEVLSALGAAHALGIVHRDLKPDNVLVTAEGHAKVLDFGIAKLAPGLAAGSPRTATGALLGTPAYMAPEQISGTTAVDPRADLYAAGVVLYECATGGVPFHGETLFDLMRAHVNDQPRPPRELRPDLPAPFEQVILTALAKDPAQRFQSAAEMVQALQRAGSALAGDEWRSLSTRAAMITGNRNSLPPVPVPAPAPAPTQPASVPSIAPAAGTTAARPPRRLRWLLVALAGLAVVAVGIGVLVGRRSGAENVTAAKRGVQLGPSVFIGTQPPVAAPTQPAAIQYDPKRFDALAFLPRAAALAKAVLPDAQLTRFDVVGVHPDGFADLTVTDDIGEVEYFFRSPAQSDRPSNVPINVEVEIACYVVVTVSATEISTQRRPMGLDADCRWPLRPPPRCTLERVWRFALQAGADARAVAKIGFLSDGKWFFDTALGGRAGTTESYDDTCP